MNLRSHAAAPTNSKLQPPHALSPPGEPAREPPLRWLGCATMPQVAEVVQSECKTCEVRVHWKVIDTDPDSSEVQPIDAPSGFVCDHWREHHEALGRTRLNKSGRAYSWPVAARLLTKH